MDSSNIKDNLTVAFIRNVSVIRIVGRGSFKISPPLKQFTHQLIDEHTVERILIDMNFCSGMDSTFMGVLAGISCYIKSKPSIEIRLVNLSETNAKLLTTLGVDRVVDYSFSANEEDLVLLKCIEKECQMLKQESINKLESAQTSLEAHQTLVDIHPQNCKKFKAVVEYLQADVDALRQK